MKKILLFIGGAMLALHLYSQQIKPLQIGDQVPDITFNQVMNYPKTQFKLSDFKGKLVILDFFGTWCGACIPGVPKLDVLQKQLKDKIQVIVICEDVSREIVRKFIKKKWNGEKNVITLPFVLYDSVTVGLFPHRMVPHEVWVSPEGKLIATTDSKEVTLDKLKNAYVGIKQPLEMKVDQMDFDWHKPLLVNGNGGSMNTLIRKSQFTRMLEGVASGAGHYWDTINHIKRLYYINLSPINFLTDAYGFSSKKFVYLKNNTVAFIDTMKNSRFKNNMQCYELTIQDTVPMEHFKGIMRKDLERQFSIKTHYDTIEIPCYILKDGENAKRLDTSNYKYDKDPSFIHFNGSFRILANILAAHGFPLVLDETTISGNIRINLPKDCFQQKDLTKRILAEMGIDLIWAKRSIKVVTVQDQNH